MNTDLDSIPTARQRIEGAAVDVIFLLLIAYLARAHVLSEAVTAGIFGMYASGRFGVKVGKQQAALLQRAKDSRSGDGSSGPPSAPGAPPNTGPTANGAAPRAGGGWLRRLALSSSPILVTVALLLAQVRSHG